MVEERNIYLTTSKCLYLFLCQKKEVKDQKRQARFKSVALVWYEDNEKYFAGTSQKVASEMNAWRTNPKGRLRGGYAKGDRGQLIEVTT